MGLSGFLASESYFRYTFFQFVLSGLVRTAQESLKCDKLCQVTYGKAFQNPVSPMPFSQMLQSALKRFERIFSEILLSSLKVP